jgi:hypothetical protein
MPLASTFALQWYGPCCAAAQLTGWGAVTAQARGTLRAAATLAGIGSVVYARPVRLVSAAAQILGLGSFTQARMRGLLRIVARIKVNELSQDDVTGAVLEAKVEGNLTLKQALRLLLAVVQGDANGLDASPSFKSLDGTKTRVAGTIAGGDRTITTRDAS